MSDPYRVHFSLLSYLELLRPVVSLRIHYLTMRDGRDRSDTMMHQRKPTRQLKDDVCS